jgi:hypothetical protein
MGLATFWAISSQTHLITLIPGFSAQEILLVVSAKVIIRLQFPGI